MSTAEGWAVMGLHAGRIFVKTVSETRRGAIVNFLVTECKMLVLNRHTDADIEAMWQFFGGSAECREVTISTIPGVAKPV